MNARKRITVDVPGTPGATMSGCFRGEPSPADVETLRAIGRAAAAFLDARHQGDDPYSRYERRKAVLARTACSAAEYERELGRIADEEGV